MIGGLTYVYLQDRAETFSPTADSIWSFADYNEAMSFAKFMDTNMIGTDEGRIYVWNWHGGSGKWNNNSFSALNNTNYPT